MSVLHQFREILTQRLQAILWRSVASDLETDAVLHDVENLDRIEQRARQFEAEGKPHLAEMLRMRAARIDADSPGGTAAAALQNLGTGSESNSMLLNGPNPADNTSGNEPKALSRSRKPRRRRPSQADADRED